MKKIYRIFRYEIPLHFVLRITNFLPDNVVFIKLRGFLVRPFLKSCGKKLGVGRNVTFYNPQKISIGHNVYIAYGCWISGETIIEDEVMFGPYCIVSPGNHQWKNGSFRNTPITKSVARIENGAWMGAKSLIIGNDPILSTGTVLAANSVLNSVSDTNSLYAGSPAVKIKTYK